MSDSKKHLDVRPVVIQSHTSWVPIQAAYVANDRGRFVWLQRLAWKVLRRYGKPAVEPHYRVGRWQPNSEVIWDAINETRERLAQMALDGKRAVLVLGVDAYQSVMTDPRADTVIRDAFVGELGPKTLGLRQGRRRYMFGVPFIYNPFQTGWCLIPEDALDSAFFEPKDGSGERRVVLPPIAEFHDVWP